METAPFDLIEEYQSEDIMSLNHSKLIHRLSVALDRYEETYDILPELELELTTGKCKPDVAIYNNLPVDWGGRVLADSLLLVLRDMFRLELNRTAIV